MLPAPTRFDAPNRLALRGRAAAIAVAIATLTACMDGSVSPMLDDAPPDVPPNPTGSRVLHGMDQGELDRLELEAETGYPSTERPGVTQGLGDRERDADRTAGATRATGRGANRAALIRARGIAHGAQGDMAPQSVDLDVPEVCDGTSALDFENGRIFFGDDCDALLAAMDQLRGSVTLNWDTATVMTEWDGVFLGTLGVERLYLHNRGLDGSIPPELGALDQLKVLSLGRNGLTGEIPPELGSMHALERLYMQDNLLTGEIPAELGKLTWLERLYLWSNDLTGEIPAEIGSMHSLERLDVGGNQLSGNIPAELGSLWSPLVQLHLWANELTGPIPNELGNLHHLEELSISGNQLTGEIPPELADLPNLEALWLYGNQLTGPMPRPNWYAGWEALQVLWLHDNQLSGPVPAELGNTDLYSLEISDNAGLTGPLPLPLQSLLLDEFFWDGTDLCSPAEPSFQAWLASIDQDYYSGGPVCALDPGNRSPVGVGSVDSVTLKPGDSTTVDASDYFRDPDGDALTYAAFSSITKVATVTVSGPVVTVNAVAEGAATIWITARDPDGMTAAQSFLATVQGDGGGDF